MKIPICPLCKSQDNKLFFSERGYDLFACNVCELFFIDPYPTASDQVYNHVSNYSYDEIEILDSKKRYCAETLYYKKYMPLIAAECNGVTSILDVGCGSGYLLKQLGILYPDTLRFGIELNKARAEMARKVSGCEIFQKPIEEISNHTKFDVITMINVLSHIPSFDTLFRSVQSLLQNNGKLILKVGEMKKDVKKNSVFDWEIPDHLHFLGFNTIDYICSKYNFKIRKHLRLPYSKELFSADRWRSPGRSAFRNAIKKVVVHMPFALSILGAFYDLIYGRKMYSSFIVLSL
ncbi:MAG: methyltransferase domain-containing protein [bacterium]